MSSVAQKKSRKRLPGFYLSNFYLPTSLSIAYARMREMVLPFLETSFGGVALAHKVERDQERELAAVEFRVDEVYLRINGWQVTVGKDELEWRNGEGTVLVFKGAMSAFGFGTEERDAERIREVKELLPKMQEELRRHELHLNHTLRFELRAVTPTKTLVSATCLGDLLKPVFDQALAWAQALWGELTPAQGIQPFPVDVNDPRLAAFDEEQKSWICAVNRGMSLKEVVKEERDISRAESFISRMRKRYPSIVREADPRRKQQGEKGGRSRRKGAACD